MRIGPWEHSRRWSPQWSMVDIHTQSGDDGKRAIPNHKCRATTNSGPGMERPREICGTALSHPLLVPEEWDKGVRRARSQIFKELRS